MGRLTDNYDYCFLTCYEQEGDWYGEECPLYKNCHERQMFEKLKHYEDLEEQGRLICLPCSIGDTVWRLFSGEIEECKVSMLQQKVDKSWKIRISHPFYLTADEKLDDLGNTWFLTKEEAEVKLKELKEGAE